MHTHLGLCSRHIVRCSGVPAEVLADATVVEELCVGIIVVAGDGIVVVARLSTA